MTAAISEDCRPQTAATDLTIRDAVEADLPAIIAIYNAAISVYVDEKLRRRGVARRLVREAIARAPSLGINALVGLIFGHNEPSLKLFEQLGFQRWGHLPGVAQLEAVERDL